MAGEAEGTAQKVDRARRVFINKAGNDRGMNGHSTLSFPILRGIAPGKDHAKLALNRLPI
jgi:hypothetical protein